MQSSVLILGARGRFGLAAARAFADAGWQVWCQMRPNAKVPQEVACDPRLQWLALDLRDTAALCTRAKGASVVVHALNPLYTNAAWNAQVLPMMESAIDISRSLAATLMVPGNVYNFGTSMPSLLTESTPQYAKTVKGQLRVQMEAMLRDSSVRSVVIRAGDFFGSGKGTWFDSTIVAKIHKGVFTYPGEQDVATPWAYLPDLARTFVAVAAKRAHLQTFEVFHFAGHRLNAQQWLDALTPIARENGWVLAQGQVRFSKLPWAVIRVGAWVMPTWAALVEMRYLWDTPHALQNAKLTALIGLEPHTPLTEALRCTLQDLNFLAPALHTA